MAEPGELPPQLVHVALFGSIHQPFEFRHVTGHVSEDRHIVLAVARELLHRRVDLGGDSKLFGGERHSLSLDRDGLGGKPRKPCLGLRSADPATDAGAGETRYLKIIDAFWRAPIDLNEPRESW